MVQLTEGPVVNPALGKVPSLRASRVALGTKPLCAVLSRCYTGLGMTDGAPCVACSGLSNSKPPETVLPKSPTFSAPAESGV